MTFLFFRHLTNSLRFLRSVPDVIEVRFTQDFLSAASTLFHSFTDHCISNVQLSLPHHAGIPRFFHTRCDSFLVAFPLAIY